MRCWSGSGGGGGFKNGKVCTTALPRSLSSSSSRPRSTSCTPVSAVVCDRQGLAEVHDGIDEKPVVLCRRQWYHSCNHSQGHGKEGGYDKPNNRVDDLFGQRCRNRANKANLVWICVRTSSSSSLTRSWAFFLQRCTTASIRTSVCFSRISFFLYDRWQKPILWLVCFATDIARRELLFKRQQHSVAIWLTVEVKTHTHSLRTLAFDCRNLVRDFASQFKESGVRALFP